MTTVHYKNVMFLPVHLSQKHHSENAAGQDQVSWTTAMGKQHF